MKSTMVCILAVASAACGVAPGDQSEAPIFGARAGAVVSGPVDLCNTDGEWDFTFSGEHLDTYEGKAVAAVAREARKNGEGSTQWVEVLRVHGMIKDGRFSLSCPDSLLTTYYYPSAAIVIDVDGDGFCSKGDMSSSAQLYGWAGDQTFQVNDVYPRLGLADEDFGPIGSDKHDFCGGFFPGRL